MNKKGQFYIIIVLIIGISIYGIVSQVNRIDQIELFEDFSQLSQNYIQESPKVVDYAIYEGKDVETELPNFTEEFIMLAKKKDPNIGLLYVYADNNSNITFRSYLGETAVYNTSKTTGELFGAQDEALDTIRINVGGKKFTHQVPVEIKNYGESFSSFSIPNTEWISLNIGGIFHNFNISNNNIPQLQVILKSTKGSSSSIYSTGNPNTPWNP